MLTYQQMAVEVAQHLAYHDAHGYSQPNRAGDGTTEGLTLSDGTAVYFHGGDYDCSSLAAMCYESAGVLPSGTWMWTGNEYDVLTGHGFVRRDFTTYDLQPGDVLWKSGHTGIYTGSGQMVDAHGDEYGGISGPNKGDQTGREIEERSVLACSWVYTYRYEGPQREGSETPSQASPSTVQTSTEEDSMHPTAFRFASDTNVRDAPSMSGNVVAQYSAGEVVQIDALAYADGIIWGCYTGGSGNRRYVAIGHTDRVSEV